MKRRFEIMRPLNRVLSNLGIVPTGEDGIA